MKTHLLGNSDLSVSVGRLWSHADASIPYRYYEFCLALPSHCRRSLAGSWLANTNTRMPAARGPGQRPVAVRARPPHVPAPRATRAGAMRAVRCRRNTCQTVTRATKQRFHVLCLWKAGRNAVCCARLFRLGTERVFREVLTHVCLINYRLNA